MEQQVPSWMKKQQPPQEFNEMVDAVQREFKQQSYSMSYQNPQSPHDPMADSRRMQGPPQQPMQQPQQRSQQSVYSQQGGLVGPQQQQQQPMVPQQYPQQMQQRPMVQQPMQQQQQPQMQQQSYPQQYPQQPVYPQQGGLQMGPQQYPVVTPYPQVPQQQVPRPPMMGPQMGIPPLSSVGQVVKSEMKPVKRRKLLLYTLISLMVLMTLVLIFSATYFFTHR